MNRFLKKVNKKKVKQRILNDSALSSIYKRRTSDYTKFKLLNTNFTNQNL